MALRMLGLIAFVAVAAIGFRSARRSLITERRLRASAVLSLVVALGAAAALLFGGSACDAKHRSGLSGAVTGIVVASVFGHLLLASTMAGRLSAHSERDASQAGNR
jgi:hypothetical protein